VLDRVSFKNFKSLRSVSIELSPLTVLVGPNSSGKSSMLRAIHLLSQTGISQPANPAPGGRFGVIFGGPHNPRRLASSTPPQTMALAMREAGGDELTLKIVIPPPGDESPDNLEFQVSVEGPAGPLSTTLSSAHRGVGTRSSADAILDHPRVRRFASAVYLHLDASIMCRTSTTDEEEPRMAANGEGLASTLAWMAGAKPDYLTAIAADLARVVPGVRRILTHRERIVDRVMEKVDIDGQPIWRPVDRPRIGDRFAIEFDNGIEVPADLLSEGTVLALGLLTKLREPRRPRLFLLDDIDRGLHIDAQAKLVATLRELMRQDPELQLVCSTHSNYLLNLFDPSEVRVLALDEQRATHAMALSDHPEFHKWKYGTQTGELWAALGDVWVTQQAEP
jgi:predicted ATPase